MRAELLLSCRLGLLLAALSFPVTSPADIPKGAFKESELESACEEAKKSGKGVALLLADSSTKEDKAVKAIDRAARSLRGHSVVVYIEGGRPPLPQPVHHPELVQRVSGADLFTRCSGR